jgi:hypothetical protein
VGHRDEALLQAAAQVLPSQLSKLGLDTNAQAKVRSAAAAAAAAARCPPAGRRDAPFRAAASLPCTTLASKPGPADDVLHTRGPPACSAAATRPDPQPAARVRPACDRHPFGIRCNRPQVLWALKQLNFRHPQLEEALKAVIPDLDTLLAA